MSRSDRTAPENGPDSRAASSAWVPSSAVGRWALGLSVLGLAAWVVLPIITALYAEKYPITNSGLMPATGTVLISVAAIFNVLCIWLWKERSSLNIVATVITIPIALFVTFMVVGGAVGGGGTGVVPDSPPDLAYATVRSSVREGQKLVMLIETDTEGARKMGRPLDDVGYTRASVRVDRSTAIQRQAIPGLKTATTDDVLAAKHVDVWFSGPVAESDPVQATARTILILAE